MRQGTCLQLSLFQWFSGTWLCSLRTCRASLIFACRASGDSRRWRSSPLSISRSMPDNCTRKGGSDTAESSQKVWFSIEQCHEPTEPHLTPASSPHNQGRLCQENGQGTAVPAKVPTKIKCFDELNSTAVSHICEGLWKSGRSSRVLHTPLVRNSSQGWRSYERQWGVSLHAWGGGGGSPVILPASCGWPSWMRG